VSTLTCTELNLLLDSEGSVIAFQEKDESWAGALAFSTEEKALSFVKASHLEVAEVAAIELADQASIAALVASLKRRPVRYLLLDLDYHTGACQQVDFSGSGLGNVKSRQFSAEHRHG
jgi:hypothetical protein